MRKRSLKLKRSLGCSLVAITLLALASCSLPTAVCAPGGCLESDRDEVKLLVDLAKTNLEGKLDVQMREIIVQSVESLGPAHPHSAIEDTAWYDCGEEGDSGYVIRLAVGESVCEFNGRIIGAWHILWREL